MGDNTRVKTIHIESELPVPAQAVRERLLDTETFRELSSPLLRFTGDLPEQWSEGTSATVRLWLFGVIPMNRHRIRVVEADPEGGWARTNEAGGALREWTHELRVEETGPSSCRYSDDVQIDAGPLTPVVATLARGLYGWRHRQWRKIAGEL